MPDTKLPQRTLKSTLTLALLFVVIYLMAGQIPAALGLSIGAMLGMVSLWTLTLAVPRLFARPGPASKMGLGMLMLMKLPFYAGVLMFAMTSPLVNPFTVFVGVAMVPAVLVLKVIGHLAVTSAQTGGLQNAK